MRSRTAWARIYRVASRALPTELRRKHGSAMEALFLREIERERERARGRFRGFVAATRGVGDLVLRGIYERLKGRGVGRWSVDGFGHDVWQAIRSLRRAPRFTVVVVLTLALGMGASSAVFSVVDAVLLRPLPFPDADRVVHLAWDGGTHVQAYLTPGKYRYWREHTRSLDAVATWWEFNARGQNEGTITTVDGLRVSEDFLEVLGYSLARGRDFTTAEHMPGGARVALVSHEMWRARFGSAPDVVGRTLDLDDEPHAVVGVLPEGFAFPYADQLNGQPHVLVPLGLSADPMDESENWPTIARLREGVTRAQAQADVAGLTESFATAYPELVYERDRGMKIASFTELWVGGPAKALWILMGAVALVLLISFANVASLFLARATRRRGEVAIRSALGASRARIVRLDLMECALVALAASTLGLLLATWSVDLMVALTPSDLPRMEAIGIDWRVAAVTYVAAFWASVGLGAAASRPRSGSSLSEILGENARGLSSRRHARRGLLVCQSAISMVLLAGAGLVVVTLVRLGRVDPGFDPEHLVAVRFPVKPPEYASSQFLWTFQQRVEEALRGSAAVASIAGATNLPLERGINLPMTISGRPEASEGAVEWRAVTPGYFGTLGVPLVAGRTFAGGDVQGAPPVVVVNEAFVRRYFPDETPIGRRIEIGRYRDAFIDPSLAGPAAEIVGIVGDVREVSLRADPRRTMYVPQAQAPTSISNVLGTMPVFIAEGRLGGRSLERALVDAIQSVDAGLPDPEVFPLSQVVVRALARERFGATLLTGFAALALALTAFGVYGVLTYTVRQRYREIGIRIALGADALDVRRLVLREGMTPVIVGLLIGLASSLVLSRTLAQYLWGVTPTDPVTLGVVAAILIGVALAASWIPAREAVRLDPATILDG